MPVPRAIGWYELTLGSTLLIIARAEKTGRAVCGGLRCQAACLGCELLSLFSADSPTSACAHVHMYAHTCTHVCTHMLLLDWAR